MNKLFCITISIIVVVSCTTKEKISEEAKKEILFQQKRDNLISEISKKYNIIYDWDTLFYNYSIEYDKIVNTDYQLISNTWIKDIYQLDTTYYISIETGIYPAFYFDLKITKADLNKILSQEGVEYFFGGLLVVDIYEIKKIKFQLEGYPEDQSYCSLELVTSDNFRGKGEIVELKLVK